MIFQKRWRAVFVGFLCLCCWLGQTIPVQAAADPQAIHVLNRLSLGLSPGDLEHVQSIGIDAYIQEQLNPQTLQLPSELEQKLQQLHTLNTATHGGDAALSKAT